MTILDEIEEEVKCPSCGAECVIKYDTQYVEDSPEWCPFCGAEIEDEEDEYIEEDEDDDEKEAGAAGAAGACGPAGAAVTSLGRELGYLLGLHRPQQFVRQG